MEYSLFYRSQLDLNKSWGNWDLFLSAYNESERLHKVFEHVNANHKRWLIYPEYGFSDSEISHLSHDEVVRIASGNEQEQCKSLLSSVSLTDFKGKSVCIDSTGFMRPQLLFLMCYMQAIGFKKIDILYSEPNAYEKGEKTRFSSGTMEKPRKVAGYHGVNSLSGEKDLLIISAGYDSDQVKRVVQAYENSDIVQLIGFPSLRPDMYQENLLRAESVSDAYGGQSLRDTIFTPAFDPFETANVIKGYITKLITTFNDIITEIDANDDYDKDSGRMLETTNPKDDEATDDDEF
jgi:hypothetical protein